MSIEDVKLDVDGECYLGRLDGPDDLTERGVLVIPGAGHSPFGNVFDRFADAATEAGYSVARFET